MRAVKFALLSNWNLNPANGQIVPVPPAGVAAVITPAQFSTDLPHCGYCTIMLQLLGLPYSVPPPAGVGPTRGRYNQAINLGYPVPDEIKNNLRFLARLFSGNGAVNPGLIIIKNIINRFVSNANRPWVLRLGPNVVTDAGVVLLAAAPGGAAIEPWDDIKSHRVTVRNETKFGTASLRDMLWKVIFKALYKETG